MMNTIVILVKAKEMVHSHTGGPENCTRGHIKLVKVRV